MRREIKAAMLQLKSDNGIIREECSSAGGNDICIGLEVMKDDAVTFWEKVAATKWGNYVTQIEARSILQGQSLAGAPGHALEIGCEGGRWSKLLSDLGWKMTCIDVNREVLEECRRKVSDAECILANCNDRTIPCASSSFSLLLCIEVPPVIQSDWFALEANRVLRNEGVLVGLACNKMSLRGLANRMAKRSFRKKAEEVYAFSYGALRRSFCRAGFEIAYEEGLCWGPFGRTSNSPLIPAFAKLERVLGLRRLVTLSPWVVFIARKVTNT